MSLLLKAALHAHVRVGVLYPLIRGVLPHDYSQ